MLTPSGLSSHLAYRFWKLSLIWIWERASTLGFDFKTAQALNYRGSELSLLWMPSGTKDQRCIATSSWSSPRVLVSEGHRKKRKYASKFDSSELSKGAWAPRTKELVDQGKTAREIHVPSNEHRQSKEDGLHGVYWLWAGTTLIPAFPMFARRMENSSL